MNHRISRRRFAQFGLAAAGLTILPFRAFGANEKLNVAVVGCAGRGGANLAGVTTPQTNIVAIADVDDARAGGASKKHPEAKIFRDVRKMLDEMHKSIDAVVVSTPDHTHAVAGMAAMKLGKHLYCEKPLTHNVAEARAMTNLAIEKKLCTQIGTQIHAEQNYRRVVEIVQSGAIGKVAEVHVWQPSVYYPGDRPKETMPVPPTLDWDLWLGPAPVRPYHSAYLPGKWRGWWDFGSGGVGDFFCHYSDLAFWALGLKYPTSVEAEGAPVHPESCAKWLIAKYDFPARGDQPAVKFTWYGGGKQPEAQLKEINKMDWKSGVLFVGEKGMVLADYGRKAVFPDSKFKDLSVPKTIPDSIGHHKEWIAGCRTGSATTCPFSYSGPLTESALLANVAYRSAEKFTWDAAAVKTSSVKANAFLQREYRKGWSL